MKPLTFEFSAIGICDGEIILGDVEQLLKSIAYSPIVPDIPRLFNTLDPTSQRDFSDFFDQLFLGDYFNHLGGLQKSRRYSKVTPIVM